MRIGWRGERSPFVLVAIVSYDSQFLDLQPKFDAMYSVIDHLNQTHVHYIALSHK